MALHDFWYTAEFRSRHDFHGMNQSRQQVVFIARAVPLTKEQEILDLACGFGRHSVELADLGYRVTGFDQSVDFLAEARQAAAARHVNVPFEQVDMRQLDQPARFDVVLSLATSLAFYDEQTNLDIFRRVHAALRPGGTFFFDQGNIFWLIKRTALAFDASTCILSRSETKETPSGPVTVGWALRFYHLPELKALLGGMGFSLAGTFGDFDGSEFVADSKRLISVWKKR